jgi:hypothetical protein
MSAVRGVRRQTTRLTGFAALTNEGCVREVQVERGRGVPVVCDSANMPLDRGHQFLRGDGLDEILRRSRIHRRLLRELVPMGG